MKLVKRPPGGALVAIAAAIITLFAWVGCGDAGGIITVTGSSSSGAGGASSSVSSTAMSSAAMSSSAMSSGGGAGGSCGPGITLCGDACVNLVNDPAHCGACDKSCENGEVCSASKCGLTCVGGSVNCGALCVDTVNDPANCGMCGKACALGEVCSMSTCGVVCLGGSTQCGMLCKDLQNDPANCGMCNKPCAPTETCGAAMCVAMPVEPTVVSTNPNNGDMGVALTATVTATFSVPMDPLTINGTTFTVMQGMTPIPGTVSYAGTQASFMPTAPFPVNALLTATITTGAQDTNGAGLAHNYVWTFTSGPPFGLGPVVLGAASTYAILAFNTVTNVNNPGTIVTGDLGISPGAALVGFPPGLVVGTTDLGTPTAALAKLALLAAYNDAVGRLGAAALPGDLSGLTLTPGVYKNSISVMLSAGNVTLDAQGDPNGVFIFQIGSTLDTNPGTQVILSGSAKATNIYWAVGTSATLGTTSKFAGTIMAGAAITMNTGGSIEGRLLAQGAAVALDTNVITLPAP